MELTRIGLGTYLGAPDAATDAGYEASARAFAEGGGNVFDTAANYRGGRSERALGRAFAGRPREGFFVSTKAGYLPMGDGGESPRDWFQRVLAGPGILAAADVVDGCHAMTPRYLAHQLGVSLEALGVARVDLFHLHNPEQQLPAIGRPAFREAIRKAFGACEDLAARGLLAEYGCATWNGFRAAPGAPDHLSLEELLEDAEAVGGPAHRFRWIQLPLNLAMPEAFTAATQPFGGRLLTPLEAARAAGLKVQVSGSLMQARILSRLPAALFPGCATPSQGALQFASSCPGVTSALCGMSRPAHVAENLPVLALPRAREEELRALVG
ncbi:aldo/keto reductase [Geothrix sp. 21YS21S-2]|uniref:aldo/keto reductase n=1 Tax=Geothrix sp. 21YS21S-2 TaxID=3068893 RepID=UPI0027B88F0F|nr:aldo/keto reductase [Geothrix sp. 21YS21S-2]